MTPATLDALALRDLLRGYRFHASDELALQDAIERILQEHHIAHKREPQLSHSDRPDFLVGDIRGPRVALEVKVDGRIASVRRQLERYAASEQVSEILLVTTRWKHAAIAIATKPLLAFVVPVGFR